MANEKNAPGALHARGHLKVHTEDSVAEQDFTPDAAATSLQTGLEALCVAIQHLLGGNPHASVIGAYASIKAISAAVDSLQGVMGKG